MTSGNIALLIFFGSITLILFILALFDYLRKRSVEHVKIAQAKIREKELDIAMIKIGAEGGFAPKSL